MGKANEPRLSIQGLRVLEFFASRAADELTGTDLMDAIGVASGTLYPLLARFERARWLTSRWEKGDPATIGRPRRRYYRITGIGARKACELQQILVRTARA